MEQNEFEQTLDHFTKLFMQYKCCISHDSFRYTVNRLFLGGNSYQYLVIGVIMIQERRGR